MFDKIEFEFQKKCFEYAHTHHINPFCPYYHAISFQSCIKADMIPFVCWYDKNENDYCDCDAKGCLIHEMQ